MGSPTPAVLLLSYCTNLKVCVLKDSSYDIQLTNAPMCVNNAVQTSQPQGFNPVCFLICFFNLPLCVNDAVQTSQP